MTSPNSAYSPDFEDKVFLVLLIGVTLFFGWIVSPFYGAVLWAALIAIVFMPLHRRVLKHLPRRRNLAAVTTLTAILLIVILPLTLVVGALLQEAQSTYQRIQSGDLDFGRYFQQVYSSLPAWIANLFTRLGLTNPGSIQQWLSRALSQRSQSVAGRVFSIGQNTLDFVISVFVMFYLLFFLLRDGEELSHRITDALPVRAHQQRTLAGKFTLVIRSIFKGTIVVAAAQGALGGLIFWFFGIHAPVLWGVVMGIASLLPAMGAPIVWVPVAIYYLLTGSIWQGLVLIAYGVLVIGLVDNLLRPILVGKETSIPDYVVLISTLGGIAIFGFNGLVIGPLSASMFITIWNLLKETKPRDAVA
ncbi:MAG: AI-2E family transporter [Thermoanaerobaculia bacterium]